MEVTFERFYQRLILLSLLVTPLFSLIVGTVSCAILGDWGNWLSHVECMAIISFSVGFVNIFLVKEDNN